VSREATAEPRPLVIGVGAMGGRLAQRLAGSGLNVTVWNRNAERARRLEGSRLRPVRELSDALPGASIVITCLSDDAAVLELWGEGALIEQGLRPGSLVIDSTSTLPGTAQGVASACRAAGLRFIDAPISGGPEAAEAGALTFFCGGESADVNDARVVLDRLGTTVAHVGGHGAGQMAKLISQVMMAGTLLGVAEGLGLAAASGVDADPLIEALGSGAAASWVLEHRAPLMVSGEFPLAGALALHLKDLDNVLHLAQALGLGLPGVELVRDLERRLEGAGYGAENVAAIARAYLSYS